MYSCFRPGKTWYDTDGKPIQAHGGSILFANDTFYWYGENKEGITGRATGTACRYWHHGVKLYSSKDLYNWKDEGLIMPASAAENNPFYPAHIMDRPHIIFNKKTGMYVMWAKTARGSFDGAAFSVCISDDIKKPFRFLHEINLPPFHAGDFDLIEEDGKGYVVYENPHTSMICQTLTEDFTSLTDEYSEHMKEKCPPFVREAPAFFQRGGRKFLLTSGTTGYFPNPSRFDEIKELHGRWVTLGNACRNDTANNSFHAQFSSVFRHPYKKDLYIALGDRWLTDLSPQMPDIQKVFHGLFDETAPKIAANADLSTFSDENTSEAKYVWLPVRFDKNGDPYIEWAFEWRIDAFETV